MSSEKSLVQILDLLTVAPIGEIESLADAGATKRAKTIRNIVNTNNIVAVGISEKISDNTKTGFLAITFYVDKKKPLKQLLGNETIPPALALDLKSGIPVPTDIIEVGIPKLEPSLAALPNPQIQRQPIQPGFSVGHPKITAGTLGAIVRKNKKLYILSNSHVLADSGTAKKGDKILYPGKIDGGKLTTDVIGELEDFVVFQMGGDYSNKTDCAIASILAERLPEVKDEIYKLGLPSGVARPKRGMKVIKVGRTTGETVGEISDVHLRLQLKYPKNLGTLGFVDQVFCSRYTMDGDSGSLVLEKDTMKAVGLHFAGFPDEKKNMGSVFNPIQDVLESLKVKLVTK